VTRALALALLALGCRTRLFEFATPIVDGSAPIDLAAFDGPACSETAFHTLEPVALGGIEQVDKLARLGALIRVRISYVRSSCEVPGPIDVAVSSTSVQITAHVWRGGSCDKRAIQESRVLAIEDGLSAAPIFVADGAPGGTATLQVDAMPEPMPVDCTAAPAGGKCTFDCQCQAADVAARCLPLGEVDGLCVRSCAEDADCPDAAPTCGAANLAPSLCGATTCGQCPFAQSCASFMQGQGCRPTTARSYLQGCCSDSACRADQICAAPGLCIYPCVEDADCAPDALCDRSAGCVPRGFM
jgi:hypothetical protein